MSSDPFASLSFTANFDEDRLRREARAHRQLNNAIELRRRAAERLPPPLRFAEEAILNIVAEQADSLTGEALFLTLGMMVGPQMGVALDDLADAADKHAREDGEQKGPT